MQWHLFSDILWNIKFDKTITFVLRYVTVARKLRIETNAKE